MSVVLPQPLEPAISKTSPGLTEKLTCLMAGSLRELYLKLRSLTTRGGVTASIMDDNLDGVTDLSSCERCGTAIDDGQFDIFLTVNQGNQIAALGMPVRG